jgi:hypothetical protein
MGRAKPFRTSGGTAALNSPGSKGSLNSTALLGFFCRLFAVYCLLFARPLPLPGPNNAPAPSPGFMQSTF